MNLIIKQHQRVEENSSLCKSYKCNLCSEWNFSAFECCRACTCERIRWCEEWKSSRKGWTTLKSRKTYTQFSQPFSCPARFSTWKWQKFIGFFARNSRELADIRSSPVCWLCCIHSSSSRAKSERVYSSERINLCYRMVYFTTNQFNLFMCCFYVLAIC